MVEGGTGWPAVRAGHALALWGGAALLASCLYVGTAARGVQWQDSGTQQYRIVTGQIAHPRGLVLSHPIQYLLGRAALRIPGLTAAFAITLVSALAAAVAVANVVLALRLLTGRTLPAVLAAAALALAHTFWQHATHTESYALAAAFLTSEWLALSAFVRSGRSGFLAWLACANGLGVGNHLLAALALPVDAVLIALAVRSGACPPRIVASAAALWMLGSAPCWVLVAGVMIQSGNWTGTLASACVGDFAHEVFNGRIDGKMLLLSGAYVAYNFPGLTVPLAVLGIRDQVFRRAAGTPVARVLFAELVIYTLFVVRYPIRDQYTFFFPVYLILSMYAGWGLQRVSAWPRTGRRRAVLALAAVTALWTPAVYGLCASAARSRHLLPAMVGNKPYRDGYRMFFIPWGAGDHSGERLNRAVVEVTRGDGLVLGTDSTTLIGIRFGQAVGQIPPAVEILELTPRAAGERSAEYQALLAGALQRGRAVVLVPRDRDHPEAWIPGARWERHGDVYRLARLERLEDTPATGVSP